MPRSYPEAADLPLAALTRLSPAQFESAAILKKVATASRKLAELKGAANAIPRQSILINTLSMREAKESSQIENIVTTHDELFQGDIHLDSPLDPAAKEVLRYREALWAGFEAVGKQSLLTTSTILKVQAVLEQNDAGFRRLPGTTLRNDAGQIVYTPPQNPDDVVTLMSDLERFMNDDDVFAADPLIKMAIVHHQFESIHPFYDGNGRTGRIVNVLYLVQKGLLDIPVLYPSQQILRTKADYYRLLQAVRTENAWEPWVIYLLDAVERTAADAVELIVRINKALLEYKHGIRAKFKFYSQDLINNLFTHPYTRIEYVERDLRVSRLTAAKYLATLAAGGFLTKRKVGRSNFYINVALTEILTSRDDQASG